MPRGRTRPSSGFLAAMGRYCMEGSGFHQRGCAFDPRTQVSQTRRVPDELSWCPAICWRAGSPCAFQDPDARPDRLRSPALQKQLMQGLFVSTFGWLVLFAGHRLHHRDVYDVLPLRAGFSIYAGVPDGKRIGLRSPSAFSGQSIKRGTGACPFSPAVPIMGIFR